MTGWVAHLIVAPILLPLAAAAAMLLFNEKRRRLKQTLSLITSVGLLVTSLALVHFVGNGSGDGAPQVYRLGDWPAPFGIVLVVDRLAALMLLLANALGLVCLIYAIARWDRSGPRFHALFLLLLMGVNGAFLTGDVFNLFVFFEVLLAASYGLALHGGGSARTTASLHYISINVATSLLFLIGVSMVYAVTGTLNLADLAGRMAAVPAQDVALLRSGLAFLGVAFLVKAGMWPLGFWLPSTYGAASPPVAAVFAILTKVGVYIVLRFGTLLLPQDAAFAVLAGTFLKYAGMATVLFGIGAVLASQTLSRLAGCYLVVSSGTLIAAIGFGGPHVTTGLLYYMIGSTLAASALYLIIEPVERNSASDEALRVFEPVFEDEYVVETGEEQETEIGIAIPGTVAVLGAGFILVALSLSGLPPLPTFLGKFALIDGLLNRGSQLDAPAWIMICLLILSGIAALVTTTRAGIDLLWTPAERTPARLNVIEAAPVGLLLAACIALTLWGGPVVSYLEKTSEELGRSSPYIEAVGAAEVRR